ncbi:MAG: magnesium transporter, partial [Planctomycetes bacterium]|nr:magnesium transporter [Planctomycetota bacterium]
NISIVYAFDKKQRLTGTLSFREVIKSLPDNQIQNIMNKDVIAVTPDADQEKVVSLMKKYDLSLMPVVDNTSKLLGVVTFDDAMDVLSEEAEEDIALLSGSLVYDPVQSKVFTRIWMRLPWLIISLFGTFLAAWILKGYEATIEQITAAVFFIPAVTAMSGNVGIQSSTTLIRGLALGQVDFSMIFKLVSKEIRTAFFIGIICGLLMTGFSYVLNSTGWSFGIIIGIAMILSVSVSAIVGTVIPLICDKFRIDPAVAAGPFITTLNDIITMIIYMGIITFGIANKFLS